MVGGLSQYESSFETHLIEGWVVSHLGQCPQIATSFRLDQSRLCGACPPPIKRAIIKSYLKRYQLREFIETGTHLGDTLADVANDSSVSCHSIELDQN